MTKKAQEGDTVRVHYIGKLDSGERFDTSVGGEPLEFTVGAGQVISGFDAAVEGMTVGESKQIRIPAEYAYGPRHEEMVLRIDRDRLPDNNEQLKEGQEIQMRMNDGQTLRAIVTAVEEDAVVFDANHPLAGETLNFDLKLMEIG